jgi:propanol-preferring alcohol dehydrogenase
MAIAARVPNCIETHAFPLEQANGALESLRGGRIGGAAVLVTR